MTLETPEKLNFEEQIEMEIENLEIKQYLFLLWLCVVRALPFLASLRAFPVWARIKKRAYFYSILNILDFLYRYYLSETRTLPIDLPPISPNLVFSTNFGRFIKEDIISFQKIQYFYRFFKAQRTLTYAVNAAEEHNINLRDIILCDLEKIKAKNYDEFDNDIGIYGYIWDNFQKVLKDNGCEYWGKLYEDIFKSGFKLDREALELRLSVPEEIQERGAAAVAKYLEKMEIEGSENLNETRIIILGEKGAGKTCLARRLIDPNDRMTELNESTPGVDTTIWEIESGDNSPAINAHIWDFAGHVITHAAHRCFLSERCLYIIVYDGRTETRNRLDYWLDHVRNYGGDAPVLVLINKFDKNKPDIEENTLRRKYPFILDEFDYFSIDTDTKKLEAFRAKTADFIRNNPQWNKQKMPKSYYKVKNSLAKRFKKGSFTDEFITKKTFEIVASENHVKKEDYDELLNHLHALGICLWYSDVEGFDTLVLNPDWITHGIYTAVNWAYNNSKYIISLSDYDSIFKEEKQRFPKEQLAYIFALMTHKKFELAYSKENKNDEITVPFLFKKDEPLALPGFPIETSLMIKYVSEQPLPPNTVCRLIIRHHEKILNNSRVWRYGVLLKYDKNTVALVHEEDRCVTIKTVGGSKSEFIAMLRETMNDIFGGYKSDKPELQYKLIENIPREVSQNNGILLSEKSIQKHAINNRYYYYDETNSDISLAQTIHDYKIEVNVFYGGNNTMGDTYNSKQTGNQGRNAGKNSTVTQNYFETTNVDYDVLLKEIEQLKNHLKKQEQSDENEILNGKLTEIKVAAKEKDKSKVLEALKTVGKEAYDIAKKVGCDLIMEILKGTISS